MKYNTTRFILVFNFVTLLFLMGCTTLFPPKEEPEQTTRIDSLKVQQKNDISALASELLYLSKQDNADLYAAKRDTLQHKITRYLRSTENPEDELLLLNHNGSIILMPFSIVMADTQLQEVLYSDTTETLFRQIGGEFSGEIVDLIVISDESGDPSFELGVLFPDSLLIFQNYVRDSSPFQTIRFTDSQSSKVKALNSNGLIFNEDLTNSSDFSLITSALESSLVYKREGKVYTNAASPDTGVSYDQPRHWRTIPGQGIFQPAGQQIIPFRGFCNFGETRYSALLDESGFLHLLDKEANTFAWSSSRPWGNRLFPLGGDSIAVVNNRENSFVVFRRENTALIPLGQSENFDGQIAAISPGEMGGNDGLLIAMNAGGAGPQQSAHILFIPKSALDFGQQVSYPVPTFPNYNSDVNVVMRHQQLAPDTALTNLPAALQRNVYETFFRKATDNQLVPLLAAVKNHNDSFTSWDFTIRPDVYYSSGRSLLASDIERGWIAHLRTCRNNNHNTEWIWSSIQGMEEYFKNPTDDIPGVVAIDQSTIRIRLTSSQPNFPELLTHPCFSVRLPVDGREYPLGTGPFQINTFENTDNRMTITAGRNLYYHGGMSPIRELQFHLDQTMVSESVSQYANMMAITNRVNEVAYFRKLSARQVRTFPAEVQYFLAINPSITPLNDTALRQVIANAVDREITASIINEVECSALNRFYSPAPIRTGPPENFAPQKFGDNLGIIFRENDIVARHIAERLAARLTQMRIPISPPEAYSESQLHEARRNGEYQILIDSFTPQFQHSIFNLADLIHRGYVLSDDLMTELADAVSHPDQAFPVDLEQRIIADAYLSPLVSVTNFAAVPLNVQNLSIFGNNELDLSGTWLPR